MTFLVGKDARARALVRRSGLFDAIYYLRANPDVADAGLDPVSHYLQTGHREGREASAFFDGASYREHNPDVGDANPLVHWLRVGAPEGRPAPLANPPGYGSDHDLVARSGLFDAIYYLRANPDVADAGLDPVSHYLQTGHREGREASAFFDGASYREHNPDVGDANPLVHWLRVGAPEGRPAPLANPPGYGSDHDLVARSGLFDAIYYLRANPDVADAGLDPVSHYLQTGHREGREASAFFDGASYREHNPDVGDANPLVHWLRVGAPEGRPAPLANPPGYGSDHDLVARSGLFDAIYYLRANPDVADAGLDPVSHYLQTGHREGREASAFFDGASYREHNPDVGDANPLVHWLRVGAPEGRPAPLANPPGYGSDHDLVARSGLFDAIYYLRANPDVADAGLDPVSHYLQTGHREGREASAFFDGASYREHNPDVGDANPLVHWLRVGAPEGRPAPLANPPGYGSDHDLVARSGLFDAIYYLRANPDVADAGLDPVSHYLQTGHREGREASAFFDGASYREHNPDVGDANPLVHWLRVGAPEGRPAPLANPPGYGSDHDLVARSGLFDAIYYLRANPDVADAGLDPVSHYLQTGHREGREASAFFDGASYREHNPDVGDANPLVHWLRVGAPEGRPAPLANPPGYGSDHDLVARSGLFDAIYYLRANPDVADAGLDPVSHYLQTGHREGREASAFFDGASYREHNPDVGDANPLVHWLRVGAPEGRPAPLANPPGYGSDHDLVARSGLFDAIYYLRANPDVADAGLDPVSHYLQTGHREGREASAFFDGASYREHNPDVGDANPLVHWLRVGAPEGRPAPISGQPGIGTNYDLVARSGLFDTGYYLRANPDVAEAGYDPIAHYLRAGHREGREPSENFDGRGYRERYPDALQATYSPLIHWLRVGVAERRAAPFTTGIHSPLALRDLCEPFFLEGGAGTVASGKLKISILTPTFNTDPCHLRELFQTLQNQSYAGWEWIIVDNGSQRADTLHALSRIVEADSRVSLTLLEHNLGISEGTNAALRRATGNYVALVDHDDLLPRSTLAKILEAVSADPEIDLIYTDECKIGPTGKIYDVLLKPDWSPSLLENTMYIGHLGVYRRDLITGLQGLRRQYDGTQDFDLALRASQEARRVQHLPIIGYIWRATSNSTALDMDAKPYALRLQEKAVAEFARNREPSAIVSPGNNHGFWRTQYPLPADPGMVSFVIPTAGVSKTVRGRRVDLVVNCVRSLEDSDFYRNREYIIVHNGNLSRGQISNLMSTGCTRLVLYDESVLNLSRKINIGVAEARGEFVCLMNDDVEIITRQGGDALVSYMTAHGEVGAMGILCLYESGAVQHNGMILLEQGPSHAGRLVDPASPPSPGNLLDCRREVFGVTGAVMLVRKNTYTQLQGFDESFPLNYNDVDFCIRLRATGLTCVVDPGIKAFHFESATKAGTFRSEKERLYLRHHRDLVDPYFNPGCDQRSANYQVGLNVKRQPTECDPIAFENWFDRRLAQRVVQYPDSKGIRFSVCVPVFNQPREFLNEMLYSVLNQTHENFELIVVDDGSRLPGTIAWLREVERTGFAQIIRHSSNRGIAAANRSWLAEATGDFVVPLDADDFLSIDALQVMAHSISRHIDSRIFFSDEFKSNLSSDKMSPFFKPNFDPILSTNCCYHTHLMAIETDFLRSIGAYSDDRTTWCHDWDTLFRAWAVNVEPIHVPELLYAWRMHANSTATGNPEAKPETLGSQRAALDTLLEARGKADAVFVRQNELRPQSGMWSLAARHDLGCVYAVSAEDFWEDAGRSLTRAIEETAVWVFLQGGQTPRETTLRELSAVALWDDRVDVVSGLLLDEDGRVAWSGGLFHPETGQLDPYVGMELSDDRSYHGQLSCQRCVDVAAPMDVVIRVEALRRLLDQKRGRRDSDGMMIALGLQAAERSRFVAVTPYVTSVWSPQSSYSLPVGRDGQLRSVEAASLRSRWYDHRLAPDQPYGIRPSRWDAL